MSAEDILLEMRKTREAFEKSKENLDIPFECYQVWCGLIDKGHVTKALNDIEDEITMMCRSCWGPRTGVLIERDMRVMVITHGRKSMSFLKKDDGTFTRYSHNKSY